jgi:hypothetical protein
MSGRTVATTAPAPDGKAVYIASYGWDFIRKYALP